jgi:HSP20 family protein
MEVFTLMLDLARWSPFGSVFQLHRELDDLFSRFFGHEGGPGVARADSGQATWWPAIESYTEGGDLHVRVALPGVDPKDVEVTVSDTTLTVRGERKSKREAKGDGSYVREFAYGTFERSLALPEGIDPGKVQARFSNGMLDLTMPAPLAVAPKKVEIQIENGSGSARAIKAA